ncbi:hypothetical protein CRE_21773 [Caenorhabditis remanei]|uniref:Secreted protein n=1 Tax=Caenorhabditis remanei TaxID=31234 RepID=E3MER8_CAERE|nr:hypothetical protein CRE_21773 [Caenorhabditis remanei]
MSFQFLNIALLFTHRLLLASSLINLKNLFVRLPEKFFRVCCIRPQVNDFFSSTVPIWNSITSNCPEFLPPGKFISLLEQSINRL